MKLAYLGFAVVSLVSGATVAQDNGLGTVTGNITLTSDYVFRGYSQTDEHPAVQAGLNWDSGAGFHLNAWGSNVDFNDGSQADVEVDLTAGYAGSVDKFSYDFGAIYYLYPGASKKLNYNYWEGYATFGYDFGGAKVNASAFYSPDFFGGLDKAWAVQGGISAPVAESLVFDVQLGRQLLKQKFGTDYTYWNAGLTYSFPWVDVGVRYHDTNVKSKACAGLCDSRAVLTISKNF